MRRKLFSPFLSPFTLAFALAASALHVLPASAREASPITFGDAVVRGRGCEKSLTVETTPEATVAIAFAGVAPLEIPEGGGYGVLRCIVDVPFSIAGDARVLLAEGSLVGSADLPEGASASVTVRAWLSAPGSPGDSRLASLRLSSRRDGEPTPASWKLDLPEPDDAGTSGAGGLGGVGGPKATASFLITFILRGEGNERVASLRPERFAAALGADVRDVPPLPGRLDRPGRPERPERPAGSGRVADPNRASKPPAGTGTKFERGSRSPRGVRPEGDLP